MRTPYQEVELNALWTISQRLLPELAQVLRRGRPLEETLRKPIESPKRTRWIASNSWMALVLRFLLKGFSWECVPLSEESERPDHPVLCEGRRANRRETRK
jgi:hypothetical protein